MNKPYTLDEYMKDLAYVYYTPVEVAKEAMQRIEDGLSCKEVTENIQSIQQNREIYLENQFKGV